jgi:hypothetical protein
VTTTKIFPRGRIELSLFVRELVKQYGRRPIVDMLKRHGRGDFGDELDFEDAEQNRRALEYGRMLFGAHNLPDGTRIWIMTDADRSRTRVFTPDEYFEADF